MQIAKWMLTSSFALAAVAPVHAAEGDGLKRQDDSNVTWARWQARLAVSQPAPLRAHRFGDADSSGLKPRSLSLMGDYLFARLNRADGSTGVLRATSGPCWARGRPCGSASRAAAPAASMPESRCSAMARNDAGAPLCRRRLQRPGGPQRLELQRRLRPDGAGRRQCRAPGRSSAYQGLDDRCANCA